MIGLDLVDDGDDFLLKVTSEECVTTNVKLTSEQLMTSDPIRSAFSGAHSRQTLSTRRGS